MALPHESFDSLEEPLWHKIGTMCLLSQYLKVGLHFLLALDQYPLSQRS